MRSILVLSAAALALMLPAPAHAQQYRQEFHGTAVSASAGVLAEGTTADLMTAPVKGFLVVTQVCSSLGNSEATLHTPTPTTYLELRSGCTTLTPGFVWPAGQIVRAENVTGSGRSGSIWISGVLVPK